MAEQAEVGIGLIRAGCAIESHFFSTTRRSIGTNRVRSKAEGHRDIIRLKIQYEKYEGRDRIIRE